MAKGLIIFHIEYNPYDNLKALGTPSKSIQTLPWATVRKYLKVDGYFKFKAQKKLFSSIENKQARPRLAKKHPKWTIEDWYCVISTDEATFQMRLDIQKYDTAMESWYFRPTFKSWRSCIRIEGAITLGLKQLVYFLQRKRRINSKK